MGYTWIIHVIVIITHGLSMDIKSSSYVGEPGYFDGNLDSLHMMQTHKNFKELNSDQ